MRSWENQQDTSRPVSDWLLRIKQKLTSLRRIGWLRLRMISVKCSAKLWSYAPLPACCLWRHAASYRHPFGFKGKGFIYCQLCRGELVKVVRDGVLGGCIHGDLPEHTPLSDLVRLGQDHLIDFSGAALEHPVDNRGLASHAKFRLERRCVCFRQKAIKGISSPAWPRWLYCLAALPLHLATARCWSTPRHAKSLHLFFYLSIYLSVCLSVCLSICLSVYLSICLSVYLSICLSVYLSICLSVYLSICLSVYLSICLSVYLSICLSVYLSICLSAYLAF